ncbi:formimidoylglutamate deiminase [Aquamicrobium sp. LC103]|uniref:formimidoylglutamate deiminase n=1 Tax=Aquamicrobium sp. LC103 TaxID=1120658 RepID=UPI00063EC024|nr:formimidoylglutamate deiminase [Aquamicrobium sp. LC103]TKT80249.1 formimidoylglutamate deiminase [Aquamicrobium sp. LC103]
MTRIFAEQLLASDGWHENVAIEIGNDGAIASLIPDASPSGADERHALFLPTIDNLHSHAFQRAMAGLAERRGDNADSFWTWRETMYAHALAMTPEQVEAVATLLYMEMLEAGFGRVGEFHYLHHAPDGSPYANIAEMAERIAAAANATGISLTLLPVFYAHSTFGGRAPNEGQRRFVNDVGRFAKLVESSREAIRGLPRANLGVAPHSLRAVAPEELSAVVALAEGGPVHIHVAEQVKEVEDCLAWSGARPVEWLLANAPVDRRWCFIHATHMTGAETAEMARRGVTAGLCPITEANLGDGIFPAPLFVENGGAFGVGSDSNVLIGLSEELRQLEYSQRLGNRARNVLTANGGSTGRALLDGALAGGAAALASGPAGIAVGNPADFFSLGLSHPTLSGKSGDAILDAWIFAGAGKVDSVWVGGRKLVESGRHHLRDEAERRYCAAIADLKSE